MNKYNSQGALKLEEVLVCITFFMHLEICQKLFRLILGYLEQFKVVQCFHVESLINLEILCQGMSNTRADVLWDISVKGP